MKKLLLMLTLLLGVSAFAQTYSVDADLDNSTTNLSTCVKPTCNPGGSGVPSSYGNAIVSSTPCGAPPDGSAMEFFVNGNAYTNALWVYKTGAMTNATHFKISFSVCFDPSIETAQAFEADLANFVSGNPGTNYMFGGQCDFGDGFYDVWDQLHPSWIQTTIPCAAASFADSNWHTFEREVHTDAAKQLWYDSLTIDGISYGESTLGKHDAGNLPVGWSSTRVWQVQLDIGPSGTGLIMYVDKFTGIAWQ